MSALETILNKLEHRKQGKEYLCHCPSHEDKKSSLSITEQDGKVLLHCHAGCEPDNILGAIGLTWKDLYSDNGYKSKEQPLTTYDYLDVTGEFVYQVVRYPNKKFVHRRPDGLDGWIYKEAMKGVKRVLYNLPIVIATINAGQPVYIVEGEKDVNKLNELGLTATCNSGGAGKWQDGFADYFKGAKVAIFPDNDQPGKQHALRVVKSLYGKAEAIKIINLPELGSKEDVSDWLDAGNTKDDLIKLVKETSTWQPKEEQNNIGVLMSDVQPEKVDWLWLGRIALGKLNVIDGDPGQGKSTLTLDITSRLSTGKAMPSFTETRQPAGVVILSAEDGLADTIKPRLIAAGADCSRILALTTITDVETDEERPFVLPDDLETIKEGVKKVGAKLLIIDPLMAFLSCTVNSHRDQDIRRVLHLLANLAEDTGVAVVVIRHLNKSSTGNSLYRGGGSIGIIGAARSGLLVAVDPDDENKRVLASTKCNLAKKPESLSFHLEDCNGVSKVAWGGTSTHNADTLLASNEEQGALEEAENVLESILANGAVLANDVKREAKEAGVSERTLYRAKAKLKVESFKEGLKAWYWELPKVASSKRDNVDNIHEIEGKDQVNDTITPERTSEGCQSISNGNVGNLQSKPTQAELSLEQAKEMIIQEFDATEISEGALLNE